MWFYFLQRLQSRGGVLHHGHPACSAAGAAARQGRSVLGDPGVGASRGQFQRGAAQVHARDPGGQQRELDKHPAFAFYYYTTKQNVHLRINRKLCLVFSCLDSVVALFLCFYIRTLCCRSLWLLFTEIPKMEKKIQFKKPCISKTFKQIIDIFCIYSVVHQTF